MKKGAEVLVEPVPKPPSSFQPCFLGIGVRGPAPAGVEGAAPLAFLTFLPPQILTVMLAEAGRVPVGMRAFAVEG